MPAAPARLDAFIRKLSQLLDLHLDEAALIPEASAALKDLVSADDWLPDAYAQPHSDHYQQYLLHRAEDAEGAARFSIVSFVWGPGQATPVHDHTVWGLIGVLRGAELAQPFRLAADGVPVEAGDKALLSRGEVEAVSPRIGDVHRVENALKDQASISIHVYGADIGQVRRSSFRPDGERKEFISGYSNTDASPAFSLSTEAAA